MPMTAATLDISCLSAGYGPIRIIEGLDLSVPAGSRLAVLGRNGMGKTTLLATIAGQTHLYGGSIRLGGVELSGLGGPERARKGLGYVPQDRCIFGSLSVEENLRAGLKGHHHSALEEAYELFPRLAERRRQDGAQLSGGEQQMLSIARTLLGQPAVLLLDEPLEGLAPIICDELMTVFGRLSEAKSMTILLVEQRIQAALAFSDHVIVLERGTIAWAGSPSEMKDQPDMVERLLGVGHSTNRG
jgi:branched-chain amino acid transport system ATP-binding protein